MIKVQLFLDSGAFSASTRGINLSIDEYIAFIKKHQEKLTVYANMDVLNDGEASYQNWLYMREAGLEPLPVYHVSTDVKYLYKYMEKTDYVAIGAVSHLDTKERIYSLDRCWSEHLTDDRGYPRVRAHGFGLTSHGIMTRYPWYSIDSTAWIKNAAYGTIFLPRLVNGQYDFLSRPWMIQPTYYSPKRRQALSSHYDCMGPYSQQYVDTYLAKYGYKIGRSVFRVESGEYKLKPGERWATDPSLIMKDIEDYERTYDKLEHVVETVVDEGACNNWRIRSHIMLIFYREMVQQLPPYPWPFERKQNYLYVGDR